MHAQCGGHTPSASNKPVSAATPLPPPVSVPPTPPTLVEPLAPAMLELLLLLARRGPMTKVLRCCARRSWPAECSDEPHDRSVVARQEQQPGGRSPSPREPAQGQATWRPVPVPVGPRVVSTTRAVRLARVWQSGGRVDLQQASPPESRRDEARHAPRVPPRGSRHRTAPGRWRREGG